MDKNKLINPKTRLSITIVFSIVITLFLLVIIKFSLNDLIEKIELKSLDWRTQIAASNNQAPSDIMLLVIDDISLQHAISNPELGLGRWPWPRSAEAEIVKYLKRADAKAIVFDIIFQGNEGVDSKNNLSDKAFIKSVKTTNNTFLAVTYTYSKNTLQNYSNSEQIRENIINISSEEFKKLLLKFVIKPEVKNFNKLIQNNIEFLNVSNILPGLLENARGIGSVTLPSSIDGITRTVRPIVYYNGNYYPSLPLAVYMFLFPKTKIELEKDKLIINDKTIALNDDGSCFLNWYGRAGTFKQFRALDVILAEKAIEQGNEDPLDPNIFKNKIVIIGLTATATDILPTPMNSAYPGTEVVATSLSNLINSNKFLSKVPDSYILLVMIVLCLTIGLVILLLNNGFTATTISLLILTAYIYASVYLYINDYLWVDIIFPSLSIFFTIMVTFISKYVITRKAFEDTYKLATTDILTGLYNRRYFQEIMYVGVQRARRYKYDLSVLLVDIDYFKKINDSYGHRAGDLVLKEVSQRLKDSFRSTDTCARYGGEEIAVVLENTSHENALIAAEKLLKTISNKKIHVKDKTDVEVTVSIGVASFPEHADSVAELIEMADQSLYYAKNNGRNCVGLIEKKVEKSESSLNQSHLDQHLVDITLKVDKELFDKLRLISNRKHKDEIAKWIVDHLKENKEENKEV